MTIRSVGATLQSNPMGAIAGGAALFFGAKQFMNVNNNLALIVLALAGGVVGANIQSRMTSKAKLKRTVIAKAS